MAEDSLPQGRRGATVPGTPWYALFSLDSLCRLVSLLLTLITASSFLKNHHPRTFFSLL